MYRKLVFKIYDSICRVDVLNVFHNMYLIEDMLLIDSNFKFYNYD